MNIGDRMRERRKSLKMTADEVAERLGVSRASVYRYEKGDIEKFPIESLEPLAKALKTTPAYLMGWDDARDITYIYNQLEPPRQVYVYSVAEEQLEEQNNILQFPTEQTRSIITNRRSAAGNMIEVDDELASKEVIPASMVPKGADELVEITGASMEPLIMQGSEVYIRHQPSVENGEVAIVRIENEGVTCKRVYFENNMIRLKSENDDYEDMFFDPSQVTVLGKVLL